MVKKNSKRENPIKGTGRSRKNRTTRKKNRSVSSKRAEVFGILVIMVSAIMLISILIPKDTGFVNQKVNESLSYVFGIGKYIIPLLLLAWGVSFFIRNSKRISLRFGAGSLMLFLSLAGTISSNLKYSAILDDVLISTRAGIVGAGIFYGLSRLFGRVGSITILVVFIIISVMILTRVSIIVLVKKIGGFSRNVDFRVFSEVLSKVKSKDIKERTAGRVPKIKTKEEPKYDKKTVTSGKKDKEIVREPELIENISKDKMKRQFGATKREQQLKMPIVKEEGEDANYRTPPTNLLKKSKTVPIKLYKQSIKERVNTLNKLFEDFNLPAKIDRVVRGPSVTMYEISLSPGVKVQRLFSLEDDFCVALGSADLRILAPIPGKSAIGLEVPNQLRSIVTLGDIFSGNDKKTSYDLISVPLGKNLSGDTIEMNIVEMPHVLIAGATNSGKSSCLNSIVISLLMKVKPSEVKFIMIDPKMVELSIYNGIPHLLSPVVVNPKKAASVLQWAVEEMENRFRILVEKKFKSLIEYNKAAKGNPDDKEFQPLPYIVLFIDELADLMMVAASEVEDSICRIAQMGRAVGMHLVIATQRPSVNVITGLIKANIPSRIAFMVTSNVDSRVILDCSGADKLTGRGDMLFLPSFLNKPVRIQGCFVTSHEIERITGYIKEEKEPEYDRNISKKISQTVKKDIDEDELFYEALKIVVDFGHASASLLQRRLKVGYSRAARIIDQLENSGFVGEFEGSKPREIIISRDELANILSKQE